MSKRSGDGERHSLPAKSSRLIRVLDFAARVGPSTQPQAGPFVSGDSGGSRGDVATTSGDGVPRGGPPSVTVTPKKNRGVIRGIRRHFGGLKAKEIDDYMLELDERDAARESRDRTWSSSEGEGEDLTPDEDSGDDYVPPGAAGDEGESELDFSGVSGLEEEGDEVPYSDGESSDGLSEGDGAPVQ